MQLHNLKKYFLVFILICSFTTAKSQGNLLYTDDRPFHLGFLLGTNVMDFGITLNDKAANVNVADVSRLVPGFTAGLISDLRLNRYLNLRFTPTIYFGERNITFMDSNEKKSEETVFSVPMAFPLYLKYSAERVQNYRPYLIAGGGFYVDFARDREKNILLKPFDTFIDFGVGCDIYFPFFKFAPELKFGLGFNNMLTPMSERKSGGIDGTHTESLSKLTTRMLTLTFNFE